MIDLLDLARLTPADFELLCKDLFQEILGTRLEIFGAGPDGGADLRGRTPDGGLLVIQCKHWETAGSRLVASMRRTERPKVERLAPARYLVATTANLTPAAKDALAAAFHPYLATSQDVYVRGDLVSELLKRPELVRRHARLWFRTADALAALVDKSLFVRAADLVRDMERSVRVFVPGRSYPDALALLEAGHVCVVSGPPGYGKTTLAHALAATYAADGYEVVALSEDADEIDRAWSEDRKQVFVGDDFLGASRAERQRHQAAARLLRVVDRVTADPGKRLLLTTREHVLARARGDDERLDGAGLERLTVTLDQREYDVAARTEIARRNVVLSRLPRDVRDGFAAGDAAGALAAHRSFNPRILAMGVRDAAQGLVTVTDEAGLHRHLVAYLDDPLRMWRHVVENQLDGAAFHLLAVLFSLGGAPARHVNRAWSALRRHLGHDADPRRFRRALRELTGSMVRQDRRHWSAGAEVTFYDSTVADFAAAYFGNDAEMLAALWGSALYFEQVEQPWDALCPHHGVLSPVVAEVRDVFVEAIRRTVDSVPITEWGTFLHRTATLVDIARTFGDDELRALVRERLAGVEVVFAPCWDEAEDSGLHLVLASLVVPRGGELYDEARMLLLPAVEAVSVDDVEEVYCLAQFVDGTPNLPPEVTRAVDAKIAAVVENALRRWDDGTSEIDEDGWWLVADMAGRHGLDVPPRRSD